MAHKVPKKLQPRFDEITALTDAVCRVHLNGEYAEMSQKLTATLARKRPSPLERGRADSWACGIVYALGFVNFLFDKSFEPYLSAEELCDAFGVSKATGYNKSKEIRDLLGLTQFEPDWTLPSQMDKNPLVWMLSVNDFIIDIRSAPRQIQEEAFRKGLIPYLPGAGHAGRDLPFHVGDSVVVKQGVQDPDFGGDLGGWQGRIIEIDEDPSDAPLATLVWDSETLRTIPFEAIARAEKEGLDWATFGLYLTELEPAAPRDTLEDVSSALEEIARRSAWLYLDEEGERIQQVLDGVDPEDTDACLEAWFDYLDKQLVFPFEARLAESDSYGPVRVGDVVRVLSFNNILDSYGILVDVKKDRSTYQVPLADLEVIEAVAPQHPLVRAYVVWFANR